MGHKQYLAVGQSASKMLGLPRVSGDKTVPLNMLISQQGKINRGRLAVILFSICTVVLGIILSFVPWLDYIIFRELRLWNGSLSYSYWQKPGVVRLTKVYIFNVTNPTGFLENGEKPRLAEVGPFVYREDMEKVNIKFHDNDTITYQHNKILRFVPEMSVDKDQKLVVPNIPLLTVTSFSPNMAGFIFNLFVSGLAISYRANAKPFVHVTAEQLVFGYDDPLVTLAHYFYPKGKRPNSQMGLLLARNGTLDEVSTIYTGQKSMERFGYIDKINGLDHLPHWKERPCNDIRASEGSFFPPRSVTKSDLVYVYDKDICRTMPLQYREDVYKDGIQTGLYTAPSSTFECADVNKDNKCFCGGEKCPPRGLQNISPCQYNAPVYLSFPHFYDAEPELIDRFEGLKPNKKKHETYFKIQPKLGVPLEGFVRVQLNIKVSRAPNIHVNNIHKFPDIYFPVMWIEEGIHEVTTPIWRWIYLATRVAPIASQLLTYSMIFFGLLTLYVVFVRAYKSFVIGQNSMEIVEIGRETLKRGSTIILHGSQRLIPCRDTSYHMLTPQTSVDSGTVRCELSQSLGDVKGFVKADLGLESESLISSDNAFIASERRCSLGFRLPHF
ncbi:scavenger receptor class B member debris buster isoform X2 [Choristoneura fumiferana]|uniref:scavenger receptor class B member debris buster isoform X2 n=1 Tax=Choristoneura fumiferana TaxID=7141 RepID=UPI003D1536D6